MATGKWPKKRAKETPKSFLQCFACFRLLSWERLNRGVSKPGCFPLFSGMVQIVSRTLSGLFLAGALNRPRKRKGTNRENPRTIPEQIGKKIPENRESPKKDEKGQKRKDKSRSGNPPVWNPPRLAALDFQPFWHLLARFRTFWTVCFWPFSGRPLSHHSPVAV